MGSDPSLMTHHNFLFLLDAMIVSVAMLSVLAIAVAVGIVRRLAHASVLLSHQVIKLDVERRHRRKFLKHLRQQFLQVLLSQLLLGRQLLDTLWGVKNRSQKVNDVGLLFIVLIKALEEVSLVIALK